jgi:hypothetical protein
MRPHRLILRAAAVLLSLPAAALLAQQPPQGQTNAPPQGQTAQPQGQGRGGANVQVGVPDGRGAAAGRQGGAGRGRAAGPPPKPAPRSADGRVLLGGATPAEKGVWLPGGGVVATTPAERAAIPLQPWAQALLADRAKNQLEPHTRCKPSGVTRPFLTPYGVEIVELPELQRIYIFDIGGPHTYRTIYMDGRTHPANLAPSYYGHSIGWWEGDTLVIDSTGFNEGFWLDRRGTPHTEQLRTLERLTRTDSATMKYEYTLEDPGALTAPYKGNMNLRWEAGTELFEYVCQQANYAHTLMLGAQESIDRSSAIVP